MDCNHLMVFDNKFKSALRFNSLGDQKKTLNQYRRIAIEPIG